MRFAILAAAAALGMSAPAEAVVIITTYYGSVTQSYDCTADPTCPVWAAAPIGSAVEVGFTHDDETQALYDVYAKWLGGEYRTGSADIQLLEGNSGRFGESTAHLVALDDGSNVYRFSGSYRPLPANPNLNGGFVSLGDRILIYKLTSVTVERSNFDPANTPFVPEPATWAMMIGGFGAIGGTMRYRRRKTSVAFV